MSAPALLLPIAATGMTGGYEETVSVDAADAAAFLMLLTQTMPAQPTPVVPTAPLSLLATGEATPTDGEATPVAEQATTIVAEQPSISPAPTLAMMQSEARPGTVLMPANATTTRLTDVVPTAVVPTAAMPTAAMPAAAEPAATEPRAAMPMGVIPNLDAPASARMHTVAPATPHTSPAATQAGTVSVIDGATVPETEGRADSFPVDAPVAAASAPKVSRTVLMRDTPRIKAVAADRPTDEIVPVESPRQATSNTVPQQAAVPVEMIRQPMPMVQPAETPVLASEVQTPRTLSREAAPAQSPANTVPAAPDLAQPTQAAEDPGTMIVSKKSDALAFRAVMLILDSLSPEDKPAFIASQHRSTAEPLVDLSARVRASRAEVATGPTLVPGETPTLVATQPATVPVAAQASAPAPTMTRLATVSPKRPMASAEPATPNGSEPTAPSASRQVVVAPAGRQDHAKQGSTQDQRHGGSGDERAQVQTEKRQPADTAVPVTYPTAQPRVMAQPFIAQDTSPLVAEASPSQAPDPKAPVAQGRQVTIELEGPSADPTRIRVAVYGSVVRATIVGDAGQTERLSEHTSELRRALEDRGFRTANVAVRSAGDAVIAAPNAPSGGGTDSEPRHQPGSKRQELAEQRRQQDSHDRQRHSRRQELEEE